MPTRFIYLLGFFAICTLLSISIYLQVFDGFVPCPLCTLQRIAFGLLGILFFFGILLHRKRIALFIVNMFAFITSGLGIFLAGRQVWLQHFPGASGNECGVSLQYMLGALPPSEVVQKIFAGSAECSQHGWDFLYLNMAEWSLVWFIGFLLLTIHLLRRSLSKHAK